MEKPLLLSGFFVSLSRHRVATPQVNQTNCSNPFLLRHADSELATIGRHLSQKYRDFTEVAAPKNFENRRMSAFR
jgi:hypothetical protein